MRDKIGTEKSSHHPRFILYSLLLHEWLYLSTKHTSAQEIKRTNETTIRFLAVHRVYDNLVNIWMKMKLDSLFRVHEQRQYLDSFVGYNEICNAISQDKGFIVPEKNLFFFLIVWMCQYCFIWLFSINLQSKGWRIEKQIESTKGKFCVFGFMKD